MAFSTGASEVSVTTTLISTSFCCDKAGCTPDKIPEIITNMALITFNDNYCFPVILHKYNTDIIFYTEEKNKALENYCLISTTDARSCLKTALKNATISFCSGALNRPSNCSNIRL